jgi:hypothetical protein
VGFDPVSLLTRALETRFGEFAIVGADLVAGREVAIKWKPKVMFDPIQPLGLHRCFSNTSCRHLPASPGPHLICISRSHCHPFVPASLYVGAPSTCPPPLPSFHSFASEALMLVFQETQLLVSWDFRVQEVIAILLAHQGTPSLVSWDFRLMRHCWSTRRLLPWSHGIKGCRLLQYCWSTRSLLPWSHGISWVQAWVPQPLVPESAHVMLPVASPPIESRGPKPKKSKSATKRKRATDDASVVTTGVPDAHVILQDAQTLGEGLVESYVVMRHPELV